MKKNLFTWGLIALATLTLATNCAKSEIEASVDDEKNVEAEGVPFELSLNTVDTKTTNDGMATAWENTDDIILFHAVNGETTYVKDGQFTVKDAATGIFQGTLNGSLDGETSYDWYALYPYYSGINTPANTSSGFTTVAPMSQTQTGNDSKEHLVNLPLAGKATTAAGVSKPAISMYQLAGVIKIVVTNNSGADLPVTSVIITTQADKTLDGHTDIYISGNYYINFTNPASAVYTAATTKSTSVTLNTGYLIPSLGTGTFYVAVKPFSVPVGDKLKVKVNNYEKTITVSGSAKDFPAGEISKINFNYNQAASIASLPFSIDGTDGYSAYSSTAGMSSNGVTKNYADSHSPYLAQFNDTGDYVQVRFNEAAGAASIGVKKIGGASNSSFNVKGSADGITFTQIESLSVTGASGSSMTLTTSASIDPSYRYLRFEFTKGDNVGVGAISISKPSTSPTINASNVSGIAVTGTTTTLSYTISNFAGSDDVEVSAVDGTVVQSASVTSAGTVTYTVNPNYGTSTANGSITLHSDAEDIDKVISVSQNGETFAYSGLSTITLTKDDNSYADITITTAHFNWASTVTASGSLNLSIDPSSGSANASAQTIRITSTTAATESEQTLGTIELYRNGNTSDDQKITIIVKKASSAGSSYTKVTSVTSGASYLMIEPTNNKVITSYDNNKLAVTDVTIGTGNTVEGNATIDDYAFVITALTGDDSGYYTIKLGSNFIGYSSANKPGTKFVTGASASTDYFKWSIDIDGETGRANIKNKKVTDRGFGWGGSDFRCYQDPAANARPVLFKKN